MPNRLTGPNQEDPAYRTFKAPREKKKKENKETYHQTELDIPLTKRNNKKIRNFFKEKNTYPV